MHNRAIYTSENKPRLIFARINGPIVHVLYLVYIGHTAVLKHFNDRLAVYQSIYMYVILVNTVQWQKNLGVRRFNFLTNTNLIHKHPI